MRIVADVSRCVGAGQCVLTDPGTFDQREDGTVLLLHDEVSGQMLAAAEHAVHLCPARVLTLVTHAAP